MNLCSEGHDEVCHEGNKCPVCDVRSDLADAKTTIGELRDTIRDKDNEISGLNDQINSQ